MTTPGINPVAAFDYVVFGGTGDLSLRKLLPALYQRDRDGQLTPDSRVFGVARSANTDEEFRAMAKDAMHRHIPESEIEPEAMERFLARVHYMSADAKHDEGWDKFAARLIDGGDHKVRVFYLSTAPDLYGPIAHRLQSVGLVNPKARIVVEKPIGHDLASAREVNEALGAVFKESQVFRIDHYLGKETVQNLLALRFGNSLFEPLWSRAGIDHVQITVSENIGIEKRSGYYDKSGALRDMIQNHLLQLLCLVAMEPPLTLDRENLRDEKLKVLRSLEPIGPAQVATHTVRGQYRAGAVDGQPAVGYLEEANVDPSSTTETFVALKAAIHNWRWAGVPFYLRTGKRLPARMSEVVIQFKPVPYNLFTARGGEPQPNRLVLRIQPDEFIRLHLMTKRPGPGGIRLHPAALNLAFADTFKHRFPDAYERLLLDVVRGNSTYFMRRDEVEAAWEWTDRILAAWNDSGERPKPYAAGTWGPTASIAMIERDGRTWHEDSDTIPVAGLD
jgi:glucose-6-phosphate 1-dehydrogenase